MAGFLSSRNANNAEGSMSSDILLVYYANTAERSLNAGWSTICSGYGATRKKSITVPRLIIATFLTVLLAIKIRFKIAAKVIVVTGCLFARDSSKPLRAYVALRAVTHIKPNHSHGQLNFGENRRVLQLGNFLFSRIHNAAEILSVNYETAKNVSTILKINCAICVRTSKKHFYW